MDAFSKLTVVSLEQAVAAPLASRHLADLGARVIKVERPEGDFARYYDSTVKGTSSYFAWLNRAKLSMTLNLKQKASLPILDKLIARADVVIENLGPGTLKRLGVDLAAKRERNPRLITCSVSGYGDGGPYSNRKAYDLLLQAEVGLLSITGSQEQPARVGISIGDIAAGMYAFSSILAALFERATSGEGAHIDTTILESLSEWLGAPWHHAHYGGGPPARAGTDHATIAPYGEYVCGDGHELLIAVQNNREWSRFCELVLQQADLRSDPRYRDNSGRVENRESLRSQIEQVFQGLKSEAVIRRLEDARIAYAHVRNVSELDHHPQLLARARIREIQGSPRLKAFLPPFNIERLSPMMGEIPKKGQHTKYLLRELGYGEHDINVFAENGVF